MEYDYNHLSEQARLLLTQNKEERIDFIRRKRWIKYTRASAALETLDDIFTEPRSHRMSNCLLVADTFNGKTTIVNRFLSLHPSSDNSEGEYAVCPVIIVHSPPTPDEGRFYSAILDKLNAPFSPNAKPEAKLKIIEDIIEKAQIKMMIIEEIHNIIAGPSKKHRQFLNALRYLCNVPRINIVATGTMEAYSAMQVDAQLANRFEPFELPRWKNDEAYLKMLASFEKRFPLRNPSNLEKNQSLAQTIHIASEGLLGEIVRILEKMAIRAVKSGEDSMTETTFRNISYIPPSKRRNPLASLTADAK